MIRAIQIAGGSALWIAFMAVIWALINVFGPALHGGHS